MSAPWDRDAQRLRDAIGRHFPNLVPCENDFDSTESLTRAQTGGEFDFRELSRSDLRPNLFGYQREIVDKLFELSVSTALLALPTGAGKTRTAATAVLDSFAAERSRRVVWLAPSIELLDQAFVSFEDLWMNHGGVQELRLSRAPILDTSIPTVFFTTPQAMYSRRTDKKYVHGWDLVIFDEAHQLGAPTFRTAIETLTKATTSPMSVSSAPPMLLGLSATPGRVNSEETEDLISFFNGNLLVCDQLAPNPVKTLQRWGVLAELEFSSLTKSTIPLDDEARRLRIAAAACVELVKRKRRPMVFAASVPGAIVLSEALRSKGVRAEAVHSRLLSIRRRQIVSDFSAGKIDVLVNKNLLSTGYDCPAISDLLILTQVNSPILFEQIVGRAARGPETGGSSVATIWEFDDHLSIHGLPRSYYRYSDFDWR